MKKTLFLISLFALTSCGMGIKQVGDLNMISKRNVIPSDDYERLRTYAGSSSKKELKHEVKRVKAKTIDQAVDYTVKNTPGGEFLTNVKVYMVDGTYFVVHGDVWGHKSQEADFKGWKVGDKIWYKSVFGQKKGTIVDLKSSEEATIQLEDGKLLNIKYDKLNKDF